MPLFQPNIIFLTLSCFLIIVNAKQLHPLSDEYIYLLNSKQSSWKAGRNFHPDTPIEYIERLMGLIEDSSRDTTRYKTKHYDENLIKSLPESFDLRKQWPNCPSLNEIKDQGGCGSDWAVAAAAAMTDKYCIQSNGTKHFNFSSEDILSCSKVGSCNGTVSLFNTWEYFRDGVVSGGPYYSKEGCRPYEIEPCEHHIQGPLKPCKPVTTPKCVESCIPGYGVDYHKDKRFGGTVYIFNGEDSIKAELFTGGPVEVGFSVYTDFLNYKHGVYRHVDGKRVGGHAAKMMGWGVENGTKYWLVANSWNTDWGDKGFFKIARGTDHLGIEEGHASYPIII